MVDLLLAYDFPPMGGGIARWMAALALGYPPGMLVVSTGTLAGDATTDVAFPNRIDRIAVSSERLRTIGGLLRWSSRATQLARSGPARFVWCDSVRPAGHVARRLLASTDTPYGIIVHGGDLLTLEQRMRSGAFKRRQLRSVLQHAAVFVANSHWTAQRCRQLFDAEGVPGLATRIRIVRLGTDPAQWQATPDAVAGFRVRHGLPPGRWIVTVARLVAYKGVDTALRVVAALAAEMPDVRYAVVGQGEQLAELQAMAAALGIGDRVHWLTDISDAELPGAYALGEVYLGLTRETATDIEGFGISFLEAAASGLPVVAAASGGIPDAVADGVTGVLVDPNSPADAIAAVRQLLGDSTRARAMGAAGRERVTRQFTWARVVGEMRAIAGELGRSSG
ncbi:MAG TPA: glycosyltransferase family 4 protein [Gemmatimonadales bacterium]|jgi:phosphatidylinositol alpha-1,6-mannosyltransferase|nr:glycosyltransferase family 4 protein [Gemmatimonadales bacterium]